MQLKEYKKMTEYLTKNNSKVYLVQDIPVDRER